MKALAAATKSVPIPPAPEATVEQVPVPPAPAPAPAPEPVRLASPPRRVEVPLPPRLRAAQVDLQEKKVALAKASGSMRNASANLRRLEEGNRWREAVEVRETLPALQAGAIEAEAAVAAAEAEMKAAEEEQESRTTGEYIAEMEPVLAAAESLLARLQEIEEWLNRTRIPRRVYARFANPIPIQGGLRTLKAWIDITRDRIGKMRK
jgi:hypothetical protein